MWIQKIRLKNIKSYAEGDRGQGVFIHLEPGVNQIAGKNGVGKSTIIEAIGYVLFNAEPVAGNSRMAKNTYLLRNGSKSGEIDVWVWHQDCLYRVERDLGNGGRRWKVVREDDDFIESEGDKEVKEFLANLAGVERPERLPEVYHSLLGVKQGRFTLPFDLKPTDAKNHFDPLLDVDIFRQCFDYLKEPCDEIRQDIAVYHNRISGLEGQMAQLQDAPAKLEEGRRQTAIMETVVKKCQEELHNAARDLEQQDEVMNRLQRKQLEVSQIKGSVERTRTEVDLARAGVEESTRAKGVLEQSEKHYHGFLGIEKEIVLLEQQRQSRDRLIKDLTALQREETGLTRDLEASNHEAAKDRELAEVKNREYLARLEVWTGDRTAYVSGELECTRLNQQAGTLKHALAQVVQWLKAMSTINKQAIDQLAELEENLTALDDQIPGRTASVKGDLEQAEEAERDCRAKLERTGQDKVNLEKQLEKLSSGQCPLLGTGCTQFNPDKAKLDLANLNAILSKVTEECEQKKKATLRLKRELEFWLEAEKKQVGKLAQARQLAVNMSRLYLQIEDPSARAASERLGLELQGLRPDLPKMKEDLRIPELKVENYRAIVESMKELQVKLYGYYQQWHPVVEDVMKLAQDTVTMRAAHGKELVAEEKALKSLSQDIQARIRSAGEAEKRSAGIKQSMAALMQRIEELERCLEDFAGLDEKVTEANSVKADCQPGYTRYLQNQPAADQLQERTRLLENHKKTLGNLQLDLSEAEQRLKEAGAAYCEEEHKRSKDEYAGANLRLGEAKSKLVDAQRAVEEQHGRVQNLHRLNQQRTQLVQELIGLQAQEKILEKGRQILKNSQELVAKNLTLRVAAQAQVIYNSMSQEASQFTWRPGDYSLTLTTVSGEKRFASLSGGQQMKAALAMQLALVREFSSAGFCAFDEPTYGLDSEGRTLLAEAIARAQNECRFEQLLLVSHDQAFDDKVEHALKLEYSPLEGTRI